MTDLRAPATSINTLREDAEFALKILQDCYLGEHTSVSPENMRLANDILEAYLLAIKG